MPENSARGMAVTYHSWGEIFEGGSLGEERSSTLEFILCLPLLICRATAFFRPYPAYALNLFVHINNLGV